jgi:hypothetical protein
LSDLSLSEIELEKMETLSGRTVVVPLWRKWGRGKHVPIGENTAIPLARPDLHKCKVSPLGLVVQSQSLKSPPRQTAVRKASGLHTLSRLGKDVHPSTSEICNIIVMPYILMEHLADESPSFQKYDGPISHTGILKNPLPKSPANRKVQLLILGSGLPIRPNLPPTYLLLPPFQKSLAICKLLPRNTTLRRSERLLCPRY